MRRATICFRAPAMALMLLLAAGCGERRPGALLARQPEFNADSAFALLVRQVEFGPRVPGTEGHARQLEWMEAYLRARADSVRLQTFEHTTYYGVHLRLTNVLAHFRPDLAQRILLVAHWDTRPTADNDPDVGRRRQPIPGANDGASGVAVLLQLADVLSRHSPPIGVDILLTDGEDYATGDMYLGARYFASQVPDGYRPLYGILLDMIGDTDPRFPVEIHSNDYAPEVVDRVWRVAEELGYGHIFVRTRGTMVEDDHVPLNRAGIRTINIIDFQYGPYNRYWHTQEDDLHNVGRAGLEAVGRVLTTLIYRGG